MQKRNVVPHLGVRALHSAATSKHPMLDEDRAICSQWPRALRETMRGAVDELPLSKQVCDKCLRAFWVTLWAGRLGAGLKRNR